MRKRPGEGARLWSALSQHYEPGVYRSKEFDRLPFLASESPTVDELRVKILDHARRDHELATVALTVLEGAVARLVGMRVA